jgi:AcrR family transcriptional regulator
MTEGDTGPAPFRAKVQEMLHTAILDAAWKRASEVDWQAVRISDIADDVGISRQTIYNEFGGKDAVARALFERDLAKFVEGLRECTDRAPDFETALRESLTWMLGETSRHPVLRRTLRAARAGSEQTLLPLLTVNVEVVLLPMRAALVEIYGGRWPHWDAEATALTCDLVIRQTISQLVAPSDFPQEQVIERIVTMVIHGHAQSAEGKSSGRRSAS